VVQAHKAQLGHMDPRQQEALIRLLETAREKLA
jgi:hypothetical protein